MRRHGRVYELGLVASYKRKRPVRRGLQDVAIGLKMLKRGKPAFRSPALENVPAIRRIFERTRLQQAPD